MDRIINESNKTGIIGNDRAKKHIALACVSTLNLNPDLTLNVIVEGEAGIGKTSLVKSILSLFPEDKIICRSRLSAKALDHMEDNLDGKILFIEELSGNDSTYSTKIMISEHVLKADIVQQNNGEHRTQTKVLSAIGTSFITTTTQPPFDLELESRVNRIYSNSSDEYKARVVEKILKTTKNPVQIRATENEICELKRELTGLRQYNVAIPYSEMFNYENISTMPNIFRNLKKILASIEANTLLNQNQRDKQDDFLIAAEEDYLSIKDVLEEMVNPPTSDRIKLESELGFNEFTVRKIQDVYDLGQSAAYDKLKYLKRNFLVRELGGGRYIVNKTILPDPNCTPAIPAISVVREDRVRDSGNSGHSDTSSQLTEEILQAMKVAESAESVENEDNENANGIKIHHMMRLDMYVMDQYSANIPK